MNGRFGILILILSWVGTTVGFAQSAVFANSVKASLVFDASPSPDFAQPLNVYLRLVNAGGNEVQWTADAVGGVDAELTDASGKPAPLPGPMAADIVGSSSAFTLPSGSRLDWKLSYNYGIAVHDPGNGYYRVQVGVHVWFIPIGKITSYSLKIHVWGWPGMLSDREKSMPKVMAAKRALLFDLPAQKIVLSH